VQGTGVWYFNAQVIQSLFVQFVRIQRVMPPVPEKLTSLRRKAAEALRLLSESKIGGG
jgi:hypothetical protein